MGGARLVLRPLTPSDATRLLADSGRQAFVVGYPSAFATEVLLLVAGHPDDAGGALGPWTVVRRRDGLVVGMLRCVPVPATATAQAQDGTRDGAGDASGAEDVAVGYEVAQGCRGRGYATEALQALLRHLLGVPGVCRVWADTDARHTASRRVMEKAGLTWRYDATDTVSGQEITVAHYAADRAR